MWHFASEALAFLGMATLVGSAVDIMWATSKWFRSSAKLKDARAERQQIENAMYRPPSKAL